MRYTLTKSEGGLFALGAGHFKITKRKWALFFALLLISTSFALVFHHHGDGDVHPDCSFCIALHVAQSVSLQHQETGLPVIVQTIPELPPERPEPVSVHLDVPVIRPPPRLISA